MNGVSWKVWSMVVICRWGTVWAFAYKDWWAETGTLVYVVLNVFNLKLINCFRITFEK